MGIINPYFFAIPARLRSIGAKIFSFVQSQDMLMWDSAQEHCS